MNDLNALIRDDVWGKLRAVLVDAVAVGGRFDSVWALFGASCAAGASVEFVAALMEAVDVVVAVEASFVVAAVDRQE